MRPFAMQVTARDGRGDMSRRVLVPLAGLALVSACASAPPAAKPPLPSRPLDLVMPLEPPDPAQLARLPGAWDQEAQRSAYRLETGPLQGASNFDDLDGRPLSAYARNPYSVADGPDRERRLITRLPSDPARPFMEAGNKAFGAGNVEEAFASYRQVIARDPLYAKPYFYLAEIESKRHDLEAAMAWNDRGLRLSPRDAYGFALRAEMAAALGREDQARAALAFALALDPFSPRALKLLRQLGGTREPGIEPPIFVQLRAGTAPGQAPVLVARAGGHPAWQRYAVCRGLLAFDARIRGEYVQSPFQTRQPGTRSLEEETTCGYMVTAAYRATPAGGPRDPDLDRWSRAYDANLLREAVIYETLGCRSPDVLPLLPDDLLGRIIDYVRQFVMPAPPASPSPSSSPIPSPVSSGEATRNNQ
jgi:tetratricopeptide (TPR) repeat protein